MGSRHFRRSLVFICLAAVLAVTAVVILRGGDLRRRYHFEKWKKIILDGLVNIDGPEPRLVLTNEIDSVAWEYLMKLQDEEGHCFLMQRVLEGGESDAAGAAIGLGSMYSNIWDTRAPIAALIIANEPALRTRAECAGSPLLRRVVGDLYTHCRDEPRVRNVKRSKPRPVPPAPGN